MKRTAIIQAHNKLSAQLKQYLLYFDDIFLHVPQLEVELNIISNLLKLIGADEFVPLNHQMMAEVESLVSHGLVTNIEIGNIPVRLARLAKDNGSRYPYPTRKQSKNVNIDKKT